MEATGIKAGGRTVGWFERILDASFPRAAEQQQLRRFGAAYHSAPLGSPMAPVYRRAQSFYERLIHSWKLGGQGRRLGGGRSGVLLMLTSGSRQQSLSGRRVQQVERSEGGTPVLAANAAGGPVQHFSAAAVDAFVSGCERAGCARTATALLRRILKTKSRNACATRRRCQRASCLRRRAAAGGAVSAGPSVRTSTQPERAQSTAG